MASVVHIVWGLATGGIETMLVNIVNRQIASADVTLIVINDLVNQQLLERIDSRVNIILLRRKIGSRNPLPFVKLNALLLRLKPTAIHSHSYTIASYLLPSLRRRSLLTMHTTLSIGNMTRSALLKYSRVYSISHSVQSMLSERFGIASKVIYNGIDFGCFKQREALQSGDIRIVQLSRLIPEKGHSLALQALKELENYPWQLDIIGSGECEQSLKQLAQSLGIANRVHFLGSKSQEYLFENLKAYDILLQPSTAEGFGLTVIEAMAAGVAVVASDIDGLKEATAYGELATLFKSGDAHALAEALKALFDHPAKLSELQRVQSAAAEKFHIASTVKQYLKEYEQ